VTALLEVQHLVKHFPVRSGLLKSGREVVHAVDDVSFCLGESETLGLVGESGCGKSTAGRSLLRLIEPTAGEVRYRGRNLLALSQREMMPLRREMQIIFQDPYGSLNPRLTIERIVEEPLVTHGIGARRERPVRVAQALERVGILPEHMKRFPHEFSGGQRQRIMIARALILGPRLIVGDEPVSALDVSVQAQVLNLMRRLQREMGFSYLIISHDLGVIRYISHRVAVMYLGVLVETAPVKELFADPLHPYSRALLSAIPMPDPARKRVRIVLKGDVPSPIRPPAGCRFHPRCPERIELCDRQTPRLQTIGEQHQVACHLYGTQGR
jgi:oligopeptide/dipeptide ABC transporter ATP-binding protein